MIKKTKSSKISTRLSFSYGLLFFLTVALMNVVILFSIQLYMKQTTQQQLLNIQDTIVENIQSSNDLNTYDFQELTNIYDNVGVIIFLDDTIYVQTDNINAVLPLNHNSLSYYEDGENTYMYTTYNISITDLGILNLQVVKNTDNQIDYFNALFSRMLIVDVFIIMISILVGYIISKKALSPIDSMTKQVNQISSSNLSKRIEINGPDDELSRLANTFNDLLSRIAQTYQLQNEFALNASHELSTPLAIINGYINLIDRWGKKDPAIYSEAINSIKHELKNMTTLLDTLYLMSKSDNELVPIDKQPFSLTELLSQIVKEYTMLYPEESVQLVTDTDVVMNADKKLISQMIRSIIDNAIKYNKNHLPIIVSAEITPNITIKIEDHGVGIPDTDIPHIFERFYRVDKARSKKIGGTGLGLSIVKWIVDRHGGSIEVQSSFGEGTTFTIHFID
ncbi:MAG: sensor histidine kinase [Candidatus Izemoplasmatales bacterium]